MRLIELADRMGDTDLCAIRSAKLIATADQRGFDVSTLKDNELGRAANHGLVRYDRALTAGLIEEQVSALLGHVETLEANAGALQAKYNRLNRCGCSHNKSCMRGPA